MMSEGKAANAVDFVFEMLRKPDRVTTQSEMGGIHAALAQELSKWVEECGGTRKILMVSPVGSVNYGLLNETSDLDMKAIYMPSFADFYHNSFPQFNFVTDVFDCQLSAAHKYIQFVLKGSMNHFEALFSPTCKAHPDFAHIIKKYLVPLIDMNTVAITRAAWFMALKAHDDATKNGWKPKKAANAIRIMVFLITYLDENKIEYQPKGVMRNAIMRLKSGDMGEEEYVPLYTAIFDTVREMAFEVYGGPGNYNFSTTVYDRDQSDTTEWSNLKAELDRVMMSLIIENENTI